MKCLKLQTTYFFASLSFLREVFSFLRTGSFENICVKGKPFSLCFSEQFFYLRRKIRKEVIQPHVPVRLPCYDLAPITGFTFGLPTQDFGYPRLSSLDGRCVQDPGTYSRERADLPLLAIPASKSRIADSYPNWGRFFEISSPLRVGNPLYLPL